MPRQNSISEKKIIQEGMSEYEYNFEYQKKWAIINRSYKRIYEVLTLIDEKQKDLNFDFSKPFVDLEPYCYTHIDEKLQGLPQLRNIIKKNISIIEKNLLGDPLELRRFSNHTLRDFDEYISTIIDCSFENISNIFSLLDDLIFNNNQDYGYIMDRFNYYKAIFNKYYSRIDEAGYASENSKNIEIQNRLDELRIYYSLIKRNFYFFEENLANSKEVNSKQISSST